jgi:KaiC/GvpD/RAD55 family RecA-like ATPase
VVRELDRISTGIRGLDEVLKGGLPKGRTILVVGSPGSGKTTFAVQFLVGGAKAGEPGLYVSLDEKPERVKIDLSSFGWNLDSLEQSGKLTLIDATPLKRPGHRFVEPSTGGENPVSFTIPELTLPSLVRSIRRIAAEEGTQRIVIDPMTSLLLRYPEEVKRRRALLHFFDALESTGCSCLVTSELRTAELERKFQLEEYLSQGVVLLHTMIHEGNIVRGIQVEKMRGISHDDQLRPYQITQTGIEVYPKDKVFQPSLR